MPDTIFRPLQVFLCHASEDKASVRKLYNLLAAEKWINPWLDEENLLPGQDFDLEIYKATRDADAIIICLSKISVTKEGYVNKEIRRALDIAQEKTEGAIYVIPLRLDDCAPSFERLKQLHWLDYFKPNAHEKLLKSLHARAIALNIEKQDITDEALPNIRPFISISDDLDLYRFIEIKPIEKSRIVYPFWIGKYPVTNAQYERFLNASDFASPFHWLEFPNLTWTVNQLGIGINKALLGWKRNSKRKIKHIVSTLLGRS
ncbi:TIR domain-containing protein [Candidatus Villigracilis affinis]|uniref:toll/interleukin-1 receptor domain-containing protein n=1 Tax=Candidatus Villigracilis affinis TaxID=3140682 RepID=UPI002A1CA1F5|nr:TIR domain-containing protein [Anaerolineales bacterium]